jgi:hypothetical protein
MFAVHWCVSLVTLNCRVLCVLVYVVCYVLVLTQDEGVSLIAIALESNAHLQVQVGSARTGNARNTRNGRSAVRVPDERER